MNHRHGYHPYDGELPDRPSKCVAIDERVCLAEIGSRIGNAVGGFILGHDAADLPVRCDGAIMVEPVDNHAVWTITGSLAGGDLTLAPSVLCTRDAFHGFVRNGAWVTA